VSRSSSSGEEGGRRSLPGFVLVEEEGDVKMAWKRAMSAGVTDADNDEVWEEAARRG
jgi:hypothetical protein